jgi:chromosome segregation protein
MLRLEKLEISGFKSFADRTALTFGEGITGVVGPNGCGKSNISDAISWVLGEQSAKNLRGAKMEDVIFNGTRDRKPLPMAEVMLTLLAIADIVTQDPEGSQEEDGGKFDAALEGAQRAAEAARSLVESYGPEAQGNQQPPQQAPKALAGVEPDGATAGQQLSEQAGSQHPAVVEGENAAPAQTGPAAAGERASQSTAEALRVSRPAKKKKLIISAGERVTVGRRLYRTGDSDYLMNGRHCLLRDVQDLFAGTGLGGAHYAIIEQGRIGQILSSKPLDRRGLIEEAAGITKFKSKKRLAELKLESARQNLTRLNDIISEVERQVNSLKRQAAKAKRYGRLRDEMRALLKLVFTADYYRLSEAAERIARDLEEARSQQEQTDSMIDAHETEHKTFSTEARAAEDHLASLRERAAAIELEADRVRNRRAFEEQQLKELTDRSQEHSRSQNALLERLGLLDTDIEQRGSGLGALQAEVMEEQSRLIKQEADYQAEMAKVREAEGNIERLRQQHVIEIGKTERLRNNCGNLDDALRRLDLRQTNLVAEQGRALAKRDETATHRAQMEADIETRRQRLAQLKSELAERGAVLQAQRAEALTLRSQMDETQAERTAAERLLKSLEEVNQQHAYYSDAVRQVLSPEHASSVNAMGTLADFVEVDQQYERLVESLFGRELQSVLVPTIDDALSGVEYLKTEGLGRGGFLVVGLHGAEEDNSDYFISNLSDDSGDEPSVDRDKDDLRLKSDAIPVPASAPADDGFQSSAFSMELLDQQNGAGEIRFQIEVLRAIDLIGIRPEIKAVVERAFPDKCTACVVPDIEAALELSMENGWRTYVTYEGEQVVNGRLIVTSGQAGLKGASLLGIKRQIKELTERCNVLRALEETQTGALDQYKTTLDELEGAVAALDREIREQEKIAAARASETQALQRDCERAEQHVRVVDAEMEQVAEERVDLDAKRAQLQLETEAAESARALAQESLTGAQSVLAEMRTGTERFSQELSSARAASAARAERLKAAQSEIRRLQNESAELNSRINKIRLELYENQSRSEQLKTSYEEGGAVAAGLETDAAGLAGEISTAAARLTVVRTRSDELSTVLAVLRQNSATAHEQKGQLEMEQVRTQSEAEHLAKSCFAELATSLADIVMAAEDQAPVFAASDPAADESDRARVGEAEGDAEGSDNTADQALDQVIEPDGGADQPEPVKTGQSGDWSTFDVAEARARLDELRIKLDEMGSVNMMALEELQESEERFQFLSAQRRDILDSIKGTEDALSEIKKRSRERFRHAFTNINENFQRMFVELFGGGRGEMVLIDEEDVLESGIDLIAQPPGKRLQNVLLLSGGEKAMAAIALVLAIFQYRPSPFCILDEVDAPLDEMNVGRFSRKILEMSIDTQFLAITHNKRTMESARALYGVTMEEPGVSKLVSVRFQ